MTRSFSRLAAHCSHPEYLDLLHEPNPRREAAAQVGTDFHRCAAEWIAAHVAGQPFFDSGYSPTVRGWLNKLRAFWTPPKWIETEVAMGLRNSVNDEPVYVRVREVEPHVYVPEEPITSDGLLTAGRLDWVWPDAEKTLVNVVDVKTGQSWLGAPHEIPQLTAQCFAAALRGGFLGATPGIYYARLGMLQWGRTVSVLDSDAWAGVVRAARRDTAPVEGPHCLACWSKSQCDAFARLTA